VRRIVKIGVSGPHGGEGVSMVGLGRSMMGEDVVRFVRRRCSWGGCDLRIRPRRTRVKVTRFFHERPWGGLRFTERKTTENATLSTRPEPDKRWIG
jgi:hypothetical protein